MPNADESVSLDTLFRIIATEAGGFYNLLITVASSFFGGSLIFMEKIAPNPSRSSMWVLGIGWFCLILCVALTAKVRLDNLQSGEKALRGEYDHAKKIDKQKICMCRWALLCLFLGMLLIMVFGLMNVPKGTSQREVAMVDQNIENVKILTNDLVVRGEDKQQSIPFGSTERARGSGTSSNSGSGSSGNAASEKKEETSPVSKHKDE